MRRIPGRERIGYECTSVHRLTQSYLDAQRLANSARSIFGKFVIGITMARSSGHSNSDNEFTKYLPSRICKSLRIQIALCEAMGACSLLSDSFAPWGSS